jgi:hypothetical protein
MERTQTPPTEIQTASSSGGHFFLPFEHGAWGTFFTCLAAGLVPALSSPGRWKALLLAAAMACLFLISDWVAFLCGAVVEGRSGRTAVWKAPAGWCLGLAAIAGIAGFYAWTEPPVRPAWSAALAAGAGAALLVLALRLWLPPRNAILLASSSAFLTLPALFLAAVAWGFHARTFLFGGVLAGYFMASVNYVQVWMRGPGISRLRAASMPLPFFLLSLILFRQGHFAAGVLSFGMAVRSSWRLYRRMHPTAGQPLRVPLRQDIMRLGWEQVLWSIGMAAVWALGNLGPGQ